MYYSRVEQAENIVVEPGMEPVIVYHTQNLAVINGPGRERIMKKQIMMMEMMMMMEIMGSITYLMNSSMQRPSRWEIHHMV
jgi:hypothetical protein